jgi:hypothetical protein
VSFYRERRIKAVRKARPCIACGSRVEVGQPALDCSGHFDGDFWSATYHAECRRAEEGLNKIHETLWSDEWLALSDMEWDDWPWLIVDHPVVAERMGITAARFEEVSAEQERVRLAWAEADRKRRERVS